MRKLLLLSLIPVALGLTACGEESSPHRPDAGGEIDLVEYFGLQPDRCFEYTTAATTQPIPSLGVTLQEDTATFKDLTTYHYTYYVDGYAVMEEWVVPADNELKLARRRYRQQTPKVIRQYSYVDESGAIAPIVIARAPMANDTGKETSRRCTVTDEEGQTILDTTCTISVAVVPKTFLLPNGDAPAGFSHVYVETPARGPEGGIQSRLFVPGTGDVPASWTVIDADLTPQGAGPKVTYKLQAIHNKSDAPGEFDTCGQ